jgi:hypothetical protein
MSRVSLASIHPAQRLRVRVAPMLVQVTRVEVMVRGLWKSCGKPVEKRLIPDFRDRVLGRKSPREAKEGETS